MALAHPREQVLCESALDFLIVISLLQCRQFFLTLGRTEAFVRHNDEQKSCLFLERKGSRQSLHVWVSLRLIFDSIS